MSHLPSNSKLQGWLQRALSPSRTTCAGQVLFIQGTLAHDLSFCTSCCPAHAGLVTLSNQFMIHRRYVSFTLKSKLQGWLQRALSPSRTSCAGQVLFIQGTLAHDISFCASCCPAHAGLVTLSNQFMIHLRYVSFTLKKEIQGWLQRALSPSRTTCAGQVLFIQGTLAHDLSFCTCCCPAHAGLVTLSNQFMMHRRYVSFTLKKEIQGLLQRALSPSRTTCAGQVLFIQGTLAHDLSFCTSCCPAHAGLVTLSNHFMIHHRYVSFTLKSKLQGCLQRALSPSRTSCAGQVLYISGTLAHGLSFCTSCCPAHAGLVTN